LFDCLELSPYEQKCSNKFYLLAGQLYRHYGGECRLLPSTALSALAEYCSIAGETLLHASAVKLRPAGEHAGQGFKIEVKCLTGQTCHYTVHSNTTLEQLK
jgi:hypothetical protein